ncbi:hypothetical protein BgiBS90_012953, partial [Biomphalaria glabrata]
CEPPVYGPDCSNLCSLSCIDRMCTNEGYCYSCPNKTGGPHCFDGCLGWCEDYEEVSNATTTPKVTHVPYRRQTGFELEHFWFHVMVLLLFVCACCCGFSELDQGQGQDSLQSNDENQFEG